MFANKYLLKNNSGVLINCDPGKNLGITVVIPCLREPEIISTLESLKNCTIPHLFVEVIVLINHSETAESETNNQNQQTKIQLDRWIQENQVEGMQFYAVGPVILKKKWAGAGLARKKGMDEAVRRFNLLNKEDGIIVSLDADTLVEKNYLTEIERYFVKNPKHAGATIAFEHQKKDLEDKQLQGIELYELYLNYYKQALDYAGYPYSMFTIGSAFAVTALAYVKRGGMNRRQAGEDFYFLQNLVQVGAVGEINSTLVYPSSRLSDRIPFGTGPILKKWMLGEEDLEMTYNFKAFSDLKLFLDRKDQFYKKNHTEYLQLIECMKASVKEFLHTDNFWNELSDLNKNCATIESFRLRFFQKFNAFKILKFLNFAHENYYPKLNLYEQIALLNKEQKA